MFQSISALLSAAAPRSLLRLAGAMLILLSLNGCAALAVSLAGAGAGAGLSHQMNGAASRTFSEPIDKVDNAVRMATKKMLIEVDEVASMDNGQVTKARVGNLDITLKLENLSPNLTRVNVVARKDMFRVDNATAQEIVVQIERALATAGSATVESGSATRSSSMNDAKFITPESANRKGSASSKRKNAI